MSEGQVLPVGLESMPTGPGLASVLASVNRSRLSAHDLYDYLAARARQLAYEQAELLADLFETALAAHEPADSRHRAADVDEHSADQIGWALHWAAGYAQSQVLLGRDLVRRLPMVWQALRAGQIDYARAAAFVDCLADLPIEVARYIATRLLDRAGRWTVAQLRERLHYHAHRADPSLAKQRYQHSVADRRVWWQPFTDGTAFIGASNLPPHLAAAAFDHLDRLARAAKAAGDPRTLAQLRADAHLALLSGIPFQLQPPTDPTTAQADTLATADGVYANDPPDIARPTPRHRAPSSKRPPTAQPDREPEPGPAPAPSAARPPTPETRPTAPPPNAAPTRRQPPWDEHDWPDHEPPDDAPNQPPDATDHSGADHSGADHHGVEQGEAIGRAVLGDAPDPHSDVRGDRCCDCGGVKPADRRGVIDLRINITTLLELDNHPAILNGFGPVLADIGRQVALDPNTNPHWQWSLTDDDGRLLAHGRTQRRPTPRQKAFIHARDQLCRTPGCRRPAIRCDLDHRIPHAHGGPTCPCNLEPACEHHHALRDIPGYQVAMLDHGQTRWTTPNGHHYDIGPDHALTLTHTDDDPICDDTRDPGNDTPPDRWYLELAA